jgi:hypothetical protein
MKLRLDHVTNSSSSSFICCITGSIESGYDLGISEAGFWSCSREHEMLKEYVLDASKVDIVKGFAKEKIERNKRLIERGKLEVEEDSNRKYFSERIPYYENRISELQYMLDNCDKFTEYELSSIIIDEGMDTSYSGSIARCPICQFKEISSNDIDRYLVILAGKSRTELAKELLHTFSSYDAMKKFLDERFTEIADRPKE